LPARPLPVRISESGKKVTFGDIAASEILDKSHHRQESDYRFYWARDDQRIEPVPYESNVSIR
jgi:hypothetical protein